jgi:hypothetical protein
VKIFLGCFFLVTMGKTLGLQLQDKDD